MRHRATMSSMVHIAAERRALGSSVPMYLACIHVPPSFQRYVRRNPYLFLPFVIALALYIYSQTLVNPWTPAPSTPARVQLETDSEALPPPSKSEVLLVTAFYPLSHSKHSANEYKRRMAAFLGHIETDVYLYAPAYLVPLVESLRPAGYKLIINSTFEHPYDIPPLTSVGRAGFDAQVALDREKRIHNAGLYAVWSAKPYFLSAAAHTARTEGNRRYRLAFWVDAGSFRASKHAYRYWPDPTRFDEAIASTKATEDAILIPMDFDPPVWFMTWNATEGPADGSWSEGSLFGGTLGAVDWYARAYYTYFAHWYANGHFVGKDQTLANGLMLMYPDRFVTVWNRDFEAPAARIPKKPSIGALGYCDDPWYYYLFWLAREDEKESMNALWRNEWHWDFWAAREPCHDTRALAVRTVIQRTFGPGWKLPPAPLKVPEETWI